MPGLLSEPSEPNLSVTSGRGGWYGSKLALPQGYSKYLARLWGVSGSFGLWLFLLSILLSCL